MLGLTTALVVLVLLLGATHAAALSNISFQGNFDQCQPPPILTWQADVIDHLKPPFHFLLVPIHASIPGHNNLLLNIPSSDKTWNATSRTGTFDALPTFPLSAGTRALVVISDSNGLGGASVPFTVGSSSNSTCLSRHPITFPSTSPIFAIQSAVTQCQPLTISWDPSNLRAASTNISVRGFVPGGATLNLGSSLTSSGSMESTAAIPHRTQLVLAFTSINDEGSETLLETSSMITVSGSDKGAAACLPKPSPARPHSKPVSHLFDGTHLQSSFQVPGMKRGAGDNIPLIVGLCIGGVALLILSGFLLHLWRERLQYGVELSRSSPYRSSQFPSTPETSWMTPPPSQRQTALSSSIYQSPGDLEKALSGGEETGGEEITSRDRTSRRKGKEKERPRQQQGRHASSSTSKSNPHLLPPSRHSLQRPPGPQRGLPMGSSSASSGPAAFDDIALPDLNLDALNIVEASDLFTPPALAGSSPPSSSQQPLSSSFGSVAGGSMTTTSAPSKRRKDSKRPRYEEMAMPALNMDALNTVEASDLFTAPASLASPPPSMVFAGSSASPSPSSTLSKVKGAKGDKEKKKSRRPSASAFLDVPSSTDPR